MIQLHDKTFESFISKEELDFSVANLAQLISEDFQDEVPIFIGVLNGSFRFLADLTKNYNFPCEVNFIKVASYQGTESTNQVNQIIGLNQDVTGRTVIIVEDIVDTGNTIVELKKMFKSHNVKHLKIATLFLKPDAYKHNIKLDYVGIRIPNKFIVGYGLDYDGLGRNLNEVYQLAE
ncbi:MAG: hypoxanthine phosphoribosyltransferase [Flavobacterium sp.]|nr:hypoxanthine phosphoribosyltransferase [Flavobacterium sp.]